MESAPVTPPKSCSTTCAYRAAASSAARRSSTPGSIAGMEALAKNGFRYPFAQYGIQQDVRAGMAVSYPDRK